jgi:hypothetical protein
MFLGYPYTLSIPFPHTYSRVITSRLVDGRLHRSCDKLRLGAMAVTGLAGFSVVVVSSIQLLWPSYITSTSDLSGFKQSEHNKRASFRETNRLGIQFDAPWASRDFGLKPFENPQNP